MYIHVFLEAKWKTLSLESHHDLVVKVYGVRDVSTSIYMLHVYVGFYFCPVLSIVSRLVIRFMVEWYLYSELDLTTSITCTEVSFVVHGSFYL